MSQKRLYNVAIVQSVTVLAADRDEAEKLARKAKLFGLEEPEYEAEPVVALWDIEPEMRDEVPYGEPDNGRTCAEIWEEWENRPEAVRRRLEAAGQTKLFEETADRR